MPAVPVPGARAGKTKPVWSLFVLVSNISALSCKCKVANIDQQREPSAFNLRGTVIQFRMSCCIGDSLILIAA